MDRNLLVIKEKRISNVIKALENNNMNGYLVKSKEELFRKIDELVDEGSKVACGGSMTLFETGVIEYLRKDRFEFLDRYEEGLNQDQIREIYLDSFRADAYFTSTNAITEEGELYNVDGNGNRVAAMMFGPKKVIIIVGVNKIVKDINEAVNRNRSISAPANCNRLKKNTPCTKVGYCVECNSEERICCEYTVIKRQMKKERIHVIFLMDELGY